MISRKMTRKMTMMMNLTKIVARMIVMMRKMFSQRKMLLWLLAIRYKAFHVRRWTKAFTEIKNGILYTLWNRMGNISCTLEIKVVPNSEAQDTVDRVLEDQVFPN